MSSSMIPGVCVSDLLLDTYLAEELADPHASELTRHLDNCVRCKARVVELEQASVAYHRSDRAIAFEAQLRARVLAKTSPSELAADAPKRAERARDAKKWGSSVKQRTGASMSGFALAALALLAVLPRAANAPDQGTRAKGTSRIGFFVKHGARVRQGHDGDRVQPGDSLRFTYSTGRAAHLTVLSFDARSLASVYFSAWVPLAQNKALPSSVELDDSLGVEHIYALFCSQEVDAEGLRLRLEKTLGAPPQSTGCELDKLRIEKVRTP